MIDSEHHVELNGVKYRLAEGGQGQHYARIAEPLRPPNSVVVQGEGRQDLFQMRPDLLLWSLTDWSGGEGQIKFNPQAPSRWAILHNVDPFNRPGQLRPGHHFEETLDSVGATWDDEAVRLLPDGRTGELIAVTVDGANETLYRWNDSTDRWGAAVAVPTVTSNPDWDGVDADDDNIYYYDATAGNLYRYNGTTATKMNSTALTTKTYVAVRELGNYVFLVRPYEYKAWSIVKTASGSTAFTEIDLGPAAKTNTDVLQAWQITKGANRIYVMLTENSGDTAIREIVPPTAAGVGYGREIARFPGVHGTSLWLHSGILFVAAWPVGEKLNERVLLYVIPGGEYGALGRVRDPRDEDFDARAVASDDGGDLLTSSFLVQGSGINPRIFTIDSKAGGFAQIGEIDQSGVDVQPPVNWKGELFVGSVDGTTKRIWRGRNDQYTTMDSYAVSPWHDFGLADEKILSSIYLAVEDMPTDWSVRVSYAADGDSAFTTAGTYATTGGTGGRFQVSDQTTSVKFRTLRIKVAFIWGGVGVPSTAPVVNSVEVRSQVSQPQPGWRLQLDLADELTGIVDQRRGFEKIDNIVATAAAKKVVEFKDGYTHRDPEEFDEFDVVIDSYTLILNRPGEGMAEVFLREVS